MEKLSTARLTKKDERIQLVFSLISDLDNAIMVTSGKERLKTVNLVLVRCWDYIESFIEVCKQILLKRLPVLVLLGYGPQCHGWLGWLVVLYAACMMLDCLTGTARAIKNGEWSSHKARQGLWHKGGSIIMVFVSVLTDILLGLTLNHISGLTLPFNYDMIVSY